MSPTKCRFLASSHRQLFAWQENAWAAATSGTSSGRGFGSGECSCSADSSGGGGWGGVSSNSGSSGKGSGGGGGGDRNGFAMGSSRCRSYSTDTRNPASDPQDETALQGQESDLASSSSGAEASGLVAAQQRPWHWVQEPAELSDTVTVNISSADLGPDHTGLYYPFDASRVPEAFQAFHQAFYPPRPQNLQRKGGCRGLQAEIATAGAPPHLMGPAGSGKSIALAALVERARARGELVVYVPDARALVSGGFFYKRPETGTYDTIISAQHILKSVLDSHRAQLEAMPRRVSAPTPAGGATGEAAAKAGAAVGAAGGGAGSLLDLVLAGLSTDDDVSLRRFACPR
ncbi:hypothetical protein MNEG_2153 [Monoraphidium neglectum]|uniref:Small ribosomal subunit protein mS29 n=1 Tax=Monoraphidium neglectum TaxID=145388 RepID=A0A0D2LH28_9CHLO|nr:hypothetical protein MNEG_2153 [Monoraphidium neglectum]KIZ05799.1 hypothetical protein MNEG_2153 [Monoraphidium neglectum]|eukprot:XP_013904818.1 hypothetical protein MNEG_2153 [Monoraphidium neglectum]